MVHIVYTISRRNKIIPSPKIMLHKMILKIQDQPIVEDAEETIIQEINPNEWIEGILLEMAIGLPFLMVIKIKLNRTTQENKINDQEGITIDNGTPILTTSQEMETNQEPTKDLVTVPSKTKLKKFML